MQDQAVIQEKGGGGARHQILQTGQNAFLDLIKIQGKIKILSSLAQFAVALVMQTLGIQQILDALFIIFTIGDILQNAEGAYKTAVLVKIRGGAD